MPKLLVTGASGFLGWNLCQIAAKDWDVYGVYHSRPLTIPGTTLLKADLTKTQDLQTLFQTCQPNAVIHLAAESPMILKHVLSQLPSKKVCCELLQTKNADGMTTLHKALAVECMESIHYMVEFCGIDSLLGILAPRASLEDFHKAMAVIAMEGATPLKDWLQRIGLI